MIKVHIGLPEIAGLVQRRISRLISAAYVAQQSAH